jgi:hypothetical protein
MKKEIENYLKQQLNAYSKVYVQDMAIDLKMELQDVKDVLHTLEGIEYDNDGLIERVPY